MALLHKEFGLPINQFDVDFVVPNLTQDLPLCIDPFLLYRSQDPELRELHAQLISHFNRGIDLYRRDKSNELATLIRFPEVDEIGFGYSEGQIGGRGLGTVLNKALADLLAEVGVLFERGIHHIEELQLLSIGIGPDLISDITANILKEYLVRYTQRQAALHGIELKKGVPINHYFDLNNQEWVDGYFDLPRNPHSGLPILLVPRRIVRLLPWINYEDYRDNEFSAFLKPKSPSPVPGRPPGRATISRSPIRSRPRSKPEVISLTRRHLDLVDRYITRKERSSQEANPALPPSRTDIAEVKLTAEGLIQHLATLQPGREDAGAYQRHVLLILNFLFGPELTNGELEEATHAGTERRDIIFMNEGTTSFWDYIRQRHAGLLIMFECKNTSELEPGDLNQSTTYLGSRLGTFGVIATRKPPKSQVMLKSYSIHNDSMSDHRKILLILSDDDLIEMIHVRADGGSATKIVQTKYRDFLLRCQ